MIMRHYRINTRLCRQIPYFNKRVSTPGKQPLALNIQVQTHNIAAVRLHHLLTGERVVCIPLPDAAIDAAGLEQREYRVQFECCDVGAVSVDLPRLHCLDDVLVFTAGHFFFQDFQFLHFGLEIGVFGFEFFDFVVESNNAVPFAF